MGKLRDAVDYRQTVQDVTALLRKARQQATLQGMPVAFAVNTNSRQYGIAGQATAKLPDSLTVQLTTAAGMALVDGSQTIVFLPRRRRHGGQHFARPRAKRRWRASACGLAVRPSHQRGPVMRRRAASRPRVRGMTLLELLVALSIMAISLALIYRAVGGSARGVSKLEAEPGRGPAGRFADGRLSHGRSRRYAGFGPGWRLCMAGGLGTFSRGRSSRDRSSASMPCASPSPPKGAAGSSRLCAPSGPCSRARWRDEPAWPFAGRPTRLHPGRVAGGHGLAFPAHAWTGVGHVHGFADAGACRCAAGPHGPSARVRRFSAFRPGPGLCHTAAGGSAQAGRERTVLRRRPARHTLAGHHACALRHGRAHPLPALGRGGCSGIALRGPGRGPMSCPTGGKASPM